ncbi:MAG: hypothetical protein AAGG48_31630, partial [Planctomycetota bacterium]
LLRKEGSTRKHSRSNWLATDHAATLNPNQPTRRDSGLLEPSHSHGAGLARLHEWTLNFPGPVMRGDYEVRGLTSGDW